MQLSGHRSANARLFEVFLFDDVPELGRRPNELYLYEVVRCDLYVGLFGSDYGTEDRDGLSPPNRRFYRATTRCLHHLIFVERSDTRLREPKMQARTGSA